MNTVVLPSWLQMLALWLFVTSSVVAALRLDNLSRHATPELPEYALWLGETRPPSATWQATTNATIKLPSDGPLELQLRPRHPLSGPVALRAFLETPTGEVSEWHPESVEIRADGTIWLRSTLPAAISRCQEISFIVTHRDAVTTKDSLRRTSANQRLLHVCVLKEDGRNHVP